MKSMRIKNVRSIVDSGDINIMPISVFLGGNGSGKSSILRLFPLLRQSVESKTIGPLLLWGDYVDYGDFRDILNRNTNGHSIVISFSIDASKHNLSRQTRYSYMSTKDSLHWVKDSPFAVKLDMKICVGKREDSTRLENIKLTFCGSEVSFSMNDNNNVNVKINGKTINNLGIKLQTRKGMLLQRIVEEQNDHEDQYYSPVAWNTNSLLYLAASRELQDVFGNTMKPSSVERILRQLPIDIITDESDALKRIITSGPGWKMFQRHIEECGNSLPKFLEYYLLWISAGLLDYCDDYIWRIAKSTLYINPLRATAERFYRSRDLAVDQVDPRGQNLPMYLLNLSEADKANFADWTLKYFGFEPIVELREGHVSIKIREASQSATVNMVDTGFGYSQVLPVIVQLWHAVNSRRSRFESRRYGTPIIFAIEQPELHLHPQFQAMLADAFVAAHSQARENKVKLVLFIETHSKTIINRLGHLVNKQRLSPSDIALYLFGKERDLDSTSISIANYDSRGYIENWPFGFLDSEAM